MNYAIKPSWDTDLAIVFTLGTITPKSTLNGLVYDGVKISAGTPTVIASKYMIGATIRNAASGQVYRNTGTVAVPAWTAL